MRSLNSREDIISICSGGTPLPLTVSAFLILGLFFQLFHPWEWRQITWPGSSQNEPYISTTLHPHNHFFLMTFTTETWSLGHQSMNNVWRYNSSPYEVSLRHLYSMNFPRTYKHNSRHLTWIFHWFVSHWVEFPFEISKSINPAAYLRAQTKYICSKTLKCIHYSDI